jgi:hypothetical protein
MVNSYLVTDCLLVAASASGLDTAVIAKIADEISAKIKGIARV